MMNYERRDAAGSSGCLVDGDTKTVTVPGSKAPPVKVPGLLNSMLGVMLKRTSRLSGFLFTFLRNEPLPGDQVTSLGPLWPLPVPYPEVFGLQSAFRSTWRKKRVVLQIITLNWLFLGRPKTCPLELWPGQKLSSRHWKRVKLLEELSEDGNSIFEVDAALMGRAAMKTESSADLLSALRRAIAASTLHGAASYGGCSSFNTSPVRENEGAELDGLDGLYGCFQGQLPCDPFVVAKPIYADRIHFVGRPGFDPMPFFDDVTAKAYAKPLECLKPGDCVRPPKVSVHASATERNLLYRKMATSGRLVYVAADDVEGQLFSGLFAVPKDLEKDRLILDARPPNTAEPVLSTWTSTMSSATALCGLELEPEQTLLMSGRDIRDFFYQFTVSKQRCRRNVLAGLLSPDHLSFIFDRRFKKPGYVGLSTLAMDDCNACEYAQGAHLKLILECGGALPSEVIQMKLPYPRNFFTVGVVIDDLVCFEKVLSAELEAVRTNGSQLDERMKVIMQKYDEVQLPTNEKKAFDNATLCSFWGVQIDGSKGLMRSNESRSWPLILITTRVVSLGLSTIGLLRSIAGSFISILSLRRRLLSAMNLIFDAISACGDDKQVLRLSGDLKDELFTLACLSTLAVVNLRAQTLGTLRATDASDWGMAAVSCELPVPVAKEAQRLGLSKSMWTRLLPPGKAWLRSKSLLSPDDELPGDEDVFDVHPFWEQLARCLSYKEEWRKQRPRAVHINIGELRAHLREESRLATNYVSKRIAYALDSQVALGSLVKGRASSKPLNYELMKSIPLVLGSDLYAAYGYWPSKLNRADGPTRSAEPDPPDEDFPWWWHLVCEGDTAEFDAWLRSLESELRSNPPAVPLNLEPVGSKKAERFEEVVRKRVVPNKIGSKRTSVARPPVGSLCPEAVEILRSFSAEQVMFRADVSGFLEPGVLDLYSGKAGVARAAIQRGAPWVVTFEITRSASEDLLKKENQTKILSLIQLNAVKVVGSALVCRSFSAAVTPAVRSARYPRGVPWMSAAMKPKVSEGNQMADFQAEVVNACEKAEPAVLYWFENPDSSYLWRQRKFRTKFRKADSDALCRVDFCRFKTPWRKRTRVGTSKLRGVRMLCLGDRNHIQLRGQHPTLKMAWTSVAQPYPRGFSYFIAESFVSACGWKLDIGGCAKTAGGRIGEASNPGPRGSKGPRGFSLEQAPVQSWTSLRIGDRQWDFFLAWCSKTLTSDPIQLFLEVPLFLAHAVRKYGDDEFVAGGSLMYYRHLVLAAQRKVPTLKPFVSICWDLATRWEKVEPVRRRPPVPEVLVQAMVALAWSFGWVRWGAVTLLCFHGVARVGEVLHCKRSDLLLPADMMFESDAAFLVLRQTKTMYRQSARIQHLKIVSDYVVLLLTQAFRDADREEQLFHGSPQVYRQRWNFLLKTLRIPSDLRITPGGLRGGGAVAWYRRGGSISDLLWAMRLKNISTLESNLQEVSAISLLTDLSFEARHSLRSAASMFCYLKHSLGV